MQPEEHHTQRKREQGRVKGKRKGKWREGGRARGWGGGRRRNAKARSVN